MWKNSDKADQKLYTISWRIIRSDFDINHQAHITANSKIQILCHMCAYQEIIMIFGFLKKIEVCHN